MHDKRTYRRQKEITTKLNFTSRDQRDSRMMMKTLAGGRMKKLKGRCLASSACTHVQGSINTAARTIRQTHKHEQLNIVIAANSRALTTSCNLQQSLR